MIRVALAGNPNSGKTTLFNALTGSSAHVGNWPGVTVDKREGEYKRKGFEPLNDENVKRREIQYVRFKAFSRS